MGGRLCTHLELPLHIGRHCDCFSLSLIAAQQPSFCDKPVTVFMTGHMANTGSEGAIAGYTCRPMTAAWLPKVLACLYMQSMASWRSRHMP